MARTPSERASRTQKCVRCTSSSSIASTACTTSAPSIRAAPCPARGGRPRAPSTSPPRARGRSTPATPTSTLRVWSRKPSERRVAGLLLGQRQARLEARVVHRRHELLREERAHRLADEVGRGDARDPEPVRDLGRDRRLARCRSRRRRGAMIGMSSACSARVAAQPADGLRAVVLRRAPRRRARRAGRGRRRRAARRRRSSSTRGASSYARSIETPAAISARAIRPFEYGSPSRRRAAAGRRGAARSVGAPSAAAARRRPRSASSARRRARAATTSFAASTTRRPRASASSATTSIAAALSSTRNVSASSAASSSRSASRSARLPRDVDDVGVEVARASRRRPAVKTRDAASSSGSSGAQPQRRSGTAPRGEPRRPSSDDEVGDEGR